MKRFNVVVAKEDGGVEVHPMKAWLRRHLEELPAGTNPTTSTSHQLRNLLRRRGWAVKELAAEVRLFPPGQVPAAALSTVFGTADDQPEPKEGLTPRALQHQTIGNIGLYFVCYQLSRRGWNVMPTARNARGVDVLIYSQDARRKLSVQVKALSKRSPVPLGANLERLFGDFFVVCRSVATDSPECFILRPTEVRALAHRGEKDGRVSYWLWPKHYETSRFREAWARIGSGLSK